MVKTYKSRHKFIKNLIGDFEKNNPNIGDFVNENIAINQLPLDEFKHEINTELSKIPRIKQALESGRIPSWLAKVIPKSTHKMLGETLKAAIKEYNKGTQTDSAETEYEKGKQQATDQNGATSSEDVHLLDNNGSSNASAGTAGGPVENNPESKEDCLAEGIKQGKEEANKELLNKENHNPLNSTFADVYKIIGWLCVLVFVSIFLITTYDVILFNFDFITQKGNLQIDPNMFNKDTQDYNVLTYIKTNSTSDEPYHVFFVEQLFAMIYVFVGITATLMGLQYGVTAVMSFYNAYTGGSKNYNVDLSKSYTYLIVILIALIGAFVLTSLYNTYFINKTQNTMINIQTNMNNIKYLMYNNFTTDPIFLSALVNNDLSTIVNQFNVTLQKGINKEDTKEAQQMIFTLSIFSYLTTSIPKIDPNYNSVLAIFDYDNIINRGIDPTLYIYYNNFNINIHNLYPQLIQSVQEGVKINNLPVTEDAPAPNASSPSSKTSSSSSASSAPSTVSSLSSLLSNKQNTNKISTVDPFFTNINNNENIALLQSQFISKVTSQLTDVTSAITQLSVNGINDGKYKLFAYMLYTFLTSVIFVIVLIIIIYDSIPESIRTRVNVALLTASTKMKNGTNYIINKLTGSSTESQ